MAQQVTYFSIINKITRITAIYDTHIHNTGCAVVTHTDAFMFTDGRYFLQAEQQLDKLATVDLINASLNLNTWPFC
jgi:hypothetical protein